MKIVIEIDFGKQPTNPQARTIISYVSERIDEGFDEGVITEVRGFEAKWKVIPLPENKED